MHRCGMDELALAYMRHRQKCPSRRWWLARTRLTRISRNYGRSARQPTGRGIHHALRGIKQVRRCRPLRCEFFSDAQSALLSVQSWRASACQEVVGEIIKKLRMSNITLCWAPSHSGIEGNERANWLAKNATRIESKEPPQRDGRPWYLVKQALKKAKITTGPLPAGRPDVGKFTRKIDAAFHLGKAAILTQHQTGKTRLKVYLYKIKAAETAELEGWGFI